MNDIITPNWNSEYTDKHRRGISDIAWADLQPQKVNYFIGDIIKFKVGGFGVIDEVNKAEHGWPPSYSTKSVEGRSFHKDGKTAWHYEGDFEKLVGESPLRNMKDVGA